MIDVEKHVKRLKIKKLIYIYFKYIVFLKNIYHYNNFQNNNIQYMDFLYLILIMVQFHYYYYLLIYTNHHSFLHNILNGRKFYVDSSGKRHTHLKREIYDLLNFLQIHSSMFGLPNNNPNKFLIQKLSGKN